MKLGSTNAARLRTAVLIGGGLAAATIAGPGLATAAVKAAQEVVIVNEQPVPVAVDGPTEVTGTVTVANQPQPPAPPAQPVPIQIRLEGSWVSRENPVANETVYTVPEGKLLTVEYAELRFWDLGADAQRGYFYVDCDGGADREGPIHSGIYHLPEIEGGNEDRIFGGPLKLLVPAGRCLKSYLLIYGRDLNEGTSVVVHGTVTGYLTDAAPAS
jgi:hypothetical protein